METTPFYIALFVHLVSLIVGFGAVIVIDTCGLLWLLKKIKLSFVEKVANITQPLIWLGWSMMVISGIPLIFMKGFVDNLTMIKFFAVTMIGLNGIYLHIIKGNLKHLTNDSPVPKLITFRITIATIISQLGWWTAIFVGFVHRHIESKINIPENPITYMVAIFFILLIIIISGETILRKKRL